MQLSRPRPALLRALSHRSFALLWTGQTLSRIGDFLYEIALAWWVLQETGSAIAMGGVLIFAFTPMLVFLLIGGVAGDRLPRVRLMLASDLLRGVLVAVVALLAFTDRLELWQVYGASLLFGFVDAFFGPAYAATVPTLLPAEDLPSANSLTSLGVQAGRIAGPALGAALVATGGTSLAFAIDSSTFFISALCLLPLLGHAMPAPTEEATPSVLRDVRAGFRTVRANSWLWITILIYALTNVTLVGPYSIAMPFLVKDFMHADVGTLGLLYAIFPAGYAISSVWLGGKARLRRRGVITYAGLVLAGLGLFVFGLPVPLLVLAAAALINGAALEAGSLAWTNTLQEMVPGEQLGRVSSIDMLWSYVLIPVGFALTGWATDALGPAPVFLLGGGITALLALLALAHPRIRELD
ncbi:MAG TPA: MFS transporter [Chloroflexia bacterium]|nr:MFS transporter [Chloroflexia bacterium]